MFGRLSEKKRAQAIVLMNESTVHLARKIIVWSTSENFGEGFVNDFKTPTKPMIDEVFILASFPIAQPYLSWRKNRADAYEDIKAYFDITFSDAFSTYHDDWAFRIQASAPGDFVSSVYDTIDVRYTSYETAWHHEMVNVDAEYKKMRHDSSLSPHPSDLAFAWASADQPFRDLVIKNLFDVEKTDEDRFRQYKLFAGTMMEKLTQYGEGFLNTVKRL